MAAEQSDGSLPPYVRIAQTLRRAIDDGQFASGDRLPSTRELASEYSVSHMTASHALRVLREEGVVESVPGRGAFVLDPAHRRERVPALSRDDLTAEVRRLQSDMDTVLKRLARVEAALADRKSHR